MNEGGIARLDALPIEEARRQLERCCGARRWVEAMLARRPFLDDRALHAAATEAFASLQPLDWLEGFAHHPRIGDVDGLRKKFAATATWAEGEQAAARAASEEVLAALAEGNRLYEERHGFMFIVCATGKSAAEMLALLRARLDNSPSEELSIAAAEQQKITHLRLEKLLSP